MIAQYAGVEQEFKCPHGVTFARRFAGGSYAGTPMEDACGRCLIARLDGSPIAETENVTLPDDMLHYHRSTRCSLSVYNRGKLWVAVDEPTWWVCHSCSAATEGTEIIRTRNPACPGCGLLRPASDDDAVRSYDLYPASGAIVVCKGRRGPVARLQAEQTPTVHDDVAVAL